WCSPTLLLLACGAACTPLPRGQAGGGAEAAGGAVQRLVVAMGTSLHLDVEAADRAAALQASEAAVRAIEVVEQRLSTWRDDSEMARLHAAPPGQPFAASAALRADLLAARRWRDATGGAFDPAIGALIAAYDLRGDGRWPSSAELDAARAACGLQHLRVVDAGVVRDADVVLDAGAFGKGAALDAAGRAALASGATAARFDFGGQLLFVGAARPRTVELADPRDRQRPALRLRIDGGSVATTGNGERRRVVDGRALGHVLDPRRGEPCADFGTVAVWARDALAADCLSTACFVLGPDRALAFVERTDGVEIAVLTTTDGSPHLTARVSSGLRDRVTALQPELDIR
ncbi:MAG: FAD:protein FMN transferase, partial [Planctomycetes bacterium]|nr:FAD:protein FMN transferase [Planctomycetota bacterium]